MPTYEYACRACGQHLEVVQSFKDAALDTCGACGGALRKVFSAAGIIFKGSGYYVTDTRAASKAAAAASSDRTKDKGDKGAKGTKDSKTETSAASSTSADSSSGSGTSSGSGSTKGGTAESA